MQKLPLNVLEKYIFTKLSDGVVKMKVYDFVPDEATYPFFSIGECALESWSSKVDWGVYVVYQITAWSDAKGMKQVNDMVDSVVEIFVGSQTALDDNFYLNGTELVSVDVHRHENGEVRFADVSLRFLIGQNS